MDWENYFAVRRGMVRNVFFEHPNALYPFLAAHELCMGREREPLSMRVVRHGIAHTSELANEVQYLIAQGLMSVSEDGRRVEMPPAFAGGHELVAMRRKQLARANQAKTSRKPISTRTRFSILKRDRFRCRYCGATPDQSQLEVDHVVPVARGGGNELTNLVTACVECNAGKSDVPLAGGV